MEISGVKRADAVYPVMEVVRNRWSPCAFAPKPVERHLLQTLFEAMRWAPSCYNEQPWSLVIGIAGEGESHAEILSCLSESNIAWASRAPVLGISVAQLAFARNGKPNRHAMHDVGLAMGSLILQAADVGLSVHQMAGFSVERAREVCQISDAYMPAAAFAIGYRGDPSEAPHAARERDESKRTRKTQEEFIFVGKLGQRWGESSS